MRDSLLIGFLFLVSVLISFSQPPIVAVLQGITINLLLLTIYTLAKHNLYESKNENIYSKRINYSLSYLLMILSILSYGITRIVLFILNYKPNFPRMNFYEKAYFVSESVFLLIFVWLLFKIIFQEVFDLEFPKKREKTHQEPLPEKEEPAKEELEEQLEKEIEEQVNMVVRKNKDHEIEKLPVIVYVD